LDFGPAAPQNPKKSLGGLLGAPLEEDLGVLGDACLNLNVVTPTEALTVSADGGMQEGKQLPVLVWVHGGANTTGCNAQLGHLFPGDAFATRGVVCVGLNYRLGLHGFLHLPAQGVTNLALRDLLAGLQWVQDDIANFGGDPDNVTVMGQSSGAINVATLLGSPRAKGLLHKAILLSGAPAQWASHAEYAETGLADFTTALLAEVPGLRLHEPSGEPLLQDVAELPHEVVSRATARIKDSMMATRGVQTLPESFLPLPDGDVVPFAPSVAGGGLVMPMLLGSGAREMSDFSRFIGGALLPWGGLGRALMGALVSRRMFLAPEPLLRNATGRRSKEALPDDEAKVACDELVQRLGGGVAAAVDLLATAPEHAMGAAAAKHQAPVYHFEVELSAEESPLVGSGHGVDMALLLRPDGPELSAEQQATGCRAFFGRDALGTEVAQAAEDLRDSLVRFATEGAPGQFGVVPWGVGGTLVVGTRPRFQAIGTDPKRELARQTIAAN
jgi:carboxylesterase type B